MSQLFRLLILAKVASQSHNTKHYTLRKPLHHPKKERSSTDKEGNAYWLLFYSFRQYNLVSIKRVEKKIDLKKGLRYFLELVVSDAITGKNFILAEYAFQPKGENVQLFYPEGLQWNRTADVYLILTAKNLGRWVHHFIKNVEKIFKETRDEHLHVIIYDFASPDINLEQALRGTVLKNYHYIRKPGKYSRTISYTEAIASVKDPNAIVVTIDLHLDLGSQFINEIRKVSIRNGAQMPDK